MRRGSKVIFYNKEKVLLQLRDDNSEIPYPNIWTLFGGRIKEGESSEDAIVREVFEELGYRLKNFDKFFVGIRNQDGVEVEDNIFSSSVGNDVLDFKLKEGQRMKFFSLEELNDVKVFEPFKKYILDFMKKSG